MKFALILSLIFFGTHINPLIAKPDSGFFLPDYMEEASFNYESVDNLIILPAVINDSIHVRLILDTGCRNIVLFGKRFLKLIPIYDNRAITVFGLGNGKNTTGFVSLENSIQINIAQGNRMPIIVVPNRSVLSNYKEVDGIVGYEIFTRFEVKIDFPKQRITFRPAGLTLNKPLETMHLTVGGTKPMISCEIFLTETHSTKMNLLIDTGSCLSLLVSTRKQKSARAQYSYKTLGRGINGTIGGWTSNGTKLCLPDREINEVQTGIIFSDTFEYASLGTGFLKDYVLILNYVQGYASLQTPTETINTF